MEVYSEECGFGFQEHYAFADGDLICDECWEFSINDVDDIINNISHVNGYVCRYGSEVYAMIE